MRSGKAAMTELPRALIDGVSDCCAGPLLMGGKPARYYVCGTCQRSCGRALEEDRSSGGTVLTKAVLDQLAAEAEAGYDPAAFHPRMRRTRGER